MTFSSPGAPTEKRFPQTGGNTIAIEGPWGSEKTGLILGLVSWFTAQGLRPAVASFSPALDLGDTGKDTAKFRRAGASPVALLAPGLCQITSAVAEEPQTALLKTLAGLAADADLVLVEGLGRNPLPRVVLIDSDPSSNWRDAPEVIALVSSRPVNADVPVFRPHEIPEVGRHILSRLHLA